MRLLIKGFLLLVCVLSLTTTVIAREPTAAERLKSLKDILNDPSVEHRDDLNDVSVLRKLPNLITSNKTTQASITHITNWHEYKAIPMGYVNKPLNYSECVCGQRGSSTSNLNIPMKSILDPLLMTDQIKQFRSFLPQFPPAPPPPAKIGISMPATGNEIMNDKDLVHRADVIVNATLKDEERKEREKKLQQARDRQPHHTMFLEVDATIGDMADVEADIAAEAEAAADAAGDDAYGDEDAGEDYDDGEDESEDAQADLEAEDEPDTHNTTNTMASPSSTAAAAAAASAAAAAAADLSPGARAAMLQLSAADGMYSLVSEGLRAQGVDLSQGQLQADAATGYGFDEDYGYDVEEAAMLDAGVAEDRDGGFSSEALDDDDDIDVSFLEVFTSTTKTPRRSILKDSGSLNNSIHAILSAAQANAGITTEELVAQAIERLRGATAKDTRQK